MNATIFSGLLNIYITFSFHHFKWYIHFGGMCHFPSNRREKMIVNLSYVPKTQGHTTQCFFHTSKKGYPCINSCIVRSDQYQSNKIGLIVEYISNLVCTWNTSEYIDILNTTQIENSHDH